LFSSFERFSLSDETFGIGTDAGGGVTGGAAGAGLGGEGCGAFDAPTGLTGLEDPREVGVDVADRGAGAERLRRSAGRAARPRLRDKGCAGGENVATTRPTFVVSVGTTGGGPSAWGPVVRRSDEVQTEAPTVAKAGKKGPIRATICFISAPATRRLAFSTPRFSSARSDGHLNAFRFATAGEVEPTSTVDEQREKKDAARRSALLASDSDEDGHRRCKMGLRSRDSWTE
jgi:hypothetical protein